MKICVASKNPIKCGAIKDAYEKYCGIIPTIVPYDASSGVSSQPMSNEETRRGAFHRVKESRQIECDLYVGIESGIEEIDGDLFCFARVYIENTEGKGAWGKGPTHQLSSAVCDLIRSGYELGDADDRVFGLINSKQSMGNIGLMTKGTITRKISLEMAAICAFSVFDH